MSTASTNAQARSQAPKPNPALNNLGLLVGHWKVDLVFPADPTDIKHAQVAFEWLEDGAFIVKHFADSTWIIGPDDSTEMYCALYHDGRGVSRIYQMSLKVASGSCGEMRQAFHSGLPGYSVATAIPSRLTGRNQRMARIGNTILS